MASVTFSKVTKEFGDVVAVNNLDIKIEDKEFLVLVGPSGCGKTTALRLLAGLEEITRGDILIGDRVVNDVSPKDRDIAMVFQSYALYPHMSVYDNMAFGLKLRKTPKDEIKRRVREAAEILGIETLLDRRPRQLSGGQRQQGDVIIGGIAKGSGMIHPDMATMLSVLTTDAAIAPQLLTELLSEVVDGSFNRISVDGDTSTNDTVLLLANGAREVSVDDAASREAFKEGLEWICLHLAHSIVRDGEGASKFVTLQITGARQESAALKVARSIATSALVKTALAGSDPNWGRILAAAGRAGVDLDPNLLRLWIGGGGDSEIQLVQDGAPLPYSEAQALEVFAGPEITLRLDLGLGAASVSFWTCDLTHDYVTINAEYHT